MRKYWLPYLLDGRVVSSRYSSLRKAMGWKERLLRAFSWKYLAMVGSAGWAILHWNVLSLVTSGAASIAGAIWSSIKLT